MDALQNAPERLRSAPERPERHGAPRSATERRGAPRSATERHGAPRSATEHPERHGAPRSAMERHRIPRTPRAPRAPRVQQKPWRLSRDSSGAPPVKYFEIKPAANPPSAACCSRTVSQADSQRQTTHSRTRQRSSGEPGGDPLGLKCAKWPQGDAEVVCRAPRPLTKRPSLTGPGGTCAPAGAVVTHLVSRDPGRGTIGRQLGPSERQVAPGRCGGCLWSAAAVVAERKPQGRVANSLRARFL